MDKGKPDIVLKFCDREVELNFVLKVRVVINFFEEWLREGANYTFFVVVDHVLEKLINKLDLKISKVKSCIIVRVILVCKV